MFLTDEDFRLVIGENALKVVTQTSDTLRAGAEKEAIEEISSYLRPKYDVDSIFTTTGEDRNSHLVMLTVDIALYHLSAAMPQKMGTEIRKERYERAIRWLEGVQAGKIIPDLTLATSEDGEPTGSLMAFGSQKPLRHNW